MNFSPLLIASLLALATLGCQSTDSSPQSSATIEPINAENQAILKTLGIKNCTRVAAYGIDWTKSGPNKGIQEEIVLNGKLNPERFPKEGINLSNDQITFFLKEGQKKWVPEFKNGIGQLRTTVGCYEPRHGIVFFDGKGRILTHVSICLRCEKFYPKPLNTKWGDNPDFKALAAFFENLGLPEPKE